MVGKNCSYIYIYLSGILAACCGDHNRNIASLREVDGGVDVILVNISFLRHRLYLPSSRQLHLAFHLTETNEA